MKYIFYEFYPLWEMYLNYLPLIIDMLINI